MHAGVGSTITDVEAIASQRRELPMNTQDQVSVLICEDSKVVGVAMKSTIEKLGCHVSGVVRSGESALSFVAKEAPDIVVMDIGLPGINGITAASRIKELLPGTRIILITGNQSEFGAIDARAANVDGYCAKDFISQQLELALESVRNGNCWFAVDAS
jgi:DNA-binding NarL/FixJ family response regulator